jgi:hypothetical protein
LGLEFVFDTLVWGDFVADITVGDCDIIVSYGDIIISYGDISLINFAARFLNFSCLALFLSELLEIESKTKCVVWTALSGQG